MYKIIIKDEFGNEEEVCEAPKEFVDMVLSHKRNKKKKKKELKGCEKYFPDPDRHCGQEYSYYKKEKRRYIKGKPGYDIWLCKTCEKKEAKINSLK